MSGLSMAGFVPADSAPPAGAWQSPPKQRSAAAAAPAGAGPAGRLLGSPNGFPEALPCGKRGQRLRRDLDLLAVGGASSLARLALARQEGAEADHGHALSLRDVLHDGVEERIDGLARRGLAHVAGLGGDLDKIGFGDDG